MNGTIANTHPDWFDFLATRTFWPEVNFWNPSDFYAFHGKPGSPFFFRLLSPRNAIGGFGYVQSFAKLPEWLAWECFGQGNGSATFEGMSARLAELRARNNIRGGSELKQIGCIILRDAVFFPPEMWVKQPSDWGRQNLRYKGYPLHEGEGARVWNDCLPLAALLMEKAGIELPEVREQPRYGEPVLVRQRLGQGAFRVAVTEAYDRACAATREHSLPALEAAHIKPFALEGPHTVNNGLLLRSDLHRLFDRGYVTVTPEHRLVVGGRLKEHFDNGKSYYPLHGSVVALPKRVADHPDPELLRWHNERFLG